VLQLVQWLAARDRGFLALRRAGRTAIVMPVMFALGDKVIGNAELATFAAFGSFATLVLVDFGGPMRDRLQAQAMLGLAGGVLVCAGTLASRNTWLAAIAMGLIGFAVLFAGVVSSVLAGAATSLLLAFILPVSLSGSVSSIPDRLAGWGMASAASLVAIAVLWPAPARDALRGPAVTACRALAARLRSDAAFLLGERASAAEHEQAIAQANAAVADLHRGFLATPYRPTGLSTAARTVVRLVDELNWLNAIIQSRHIAEGGDVGLATRTVEAAAAAVLDVGADLLESPDKDPAALSAALSELRAALAAMERSATVDLPVKRVAVGSSSPGAEQRTREIITSLDPSFRAQELSFAVSQIARNIGLTLAAERRSWWERLLGRQPEGLPGTLSAARERAATHIDPHSVSLQNSVRAAIALALAVLVAKQTGVQHSFWVILGTLSVLRSNALNTGQFVLRGVLGTAIGFVVGSAVVAVIGTNTAVLWLLLPLAVLFAGIAPSVISFTAGQAAFTLTLLILFNIIQPAGWQLGLVRVEDVALGCGVSLAVGLLFWPRGAGAALRRALAEAYADAVHYLHGAVTFGMFCCDFGAPTPTAPTDEAARSAAASRRLDDAFRTYLAERGPKPVPLAEITSLVTGAAAVRLAADAVLDMWQRDQRQAEGDRTAARSELLATSALVRDWYDELATSLADRGEVPAPLEQDTVADGRFVAAVRHDLLDRDGNATATAVRMIWTGDHLDAARRMQAALVEPARATTDPRVLSPLAGIRPWRHARATAPQT
jgi:fusaric acid resistance family protein